MATSPPVGGAPKLKLKFGGGGGGVTSAPAKAGSPPLDSIAKPAKRKYSRKPKPDANIDGDLKSPSTSKTQKKRARKDEDDEEADGTASRKAAKGTGGLKLRISSINTKPPPQISTDELASSAAVPASSNGISFKKKNPAERLKVKLRTSSQIVRLVNNKAASQLPPREPGAGYDSEAESVEDDPAIEQQFVIRMLPGPDCDYLREAIENRKIGVSAANGGADVRLRFLQRDGRRAMLSIRGNNYVAFLLDLPTIVESLKSWDKKNYYKAADIHQLLLVTQSVKDESEARSAELPDDIGIDPGTWQYPHGLTPPMHWVRKRRFRTRINQRTIEEVEEIVERLLDLDDQCIKDGGSSIFTVFDPHANDDDEGDDEVDADGEDDYDGIQQSIEADLDGAADGLGEDEEDDDLAMLMAAELGREDVDEEDVQGDVLQTITGRVMASPETMTQGNETPVDATRTQTQATTAAPSASSSMAPPSGTIDQQGDSAIPRATRSEDEEEDSDDQDDDEEELDEEELAAQQEKAQQREEIADMEQEVEELDKRIAALSNPMLKLKFKEKRDKLVRDLKLKKMNMGEDVESDEE